MLYRVSADALKEGMQADCDMFDTDFSFDSILNEEPPSSSSAAPLAIQVI